VNSFFLIYFNSVLD